ncbi:hypothetical protein AURDEDRAFT_176850 [Auricularia subglabra TFB-10046 SS5]|uniref:Uncharacterized protein n=1 Tax=Auricularia subglabra (strain TFB-10046 / SS5) TaxID=717982 RepID=J0LC83_AURST|nr:hypothetical protein AURDEDRAFT_176850 [Auricularia subglabra TFB-10046 SS5]
MASGRSHGRTSTVRRAHEHIAPRLASSGLRTADADVTHHNPSIATDFRDDPDTDGVDHFASQHGRPTSATHSYARWLRNGALSAYNAITPLLVPQDPAAGFNSNFAGSGDDSTDDDGGINMNTATAGLQALAVLFSPSNCVDPAHARKVLVCIGRVVALIALAFFIFDPSTSFKAKAFFLLGVAVVIGMAVLVHDHHRQRRQRPVLP